MLITDAAAFSLSRFSIARLTPGGGDLPRPSGGSAAHSKEIRRPQRYLALILFAACPGVAISAGSGFHGSTLHNAAERDGIGRLCLPSEGVV